MLRFGVIGTGRFGKHYPRLLQGLEGVSLTATANRTDGKGDALISDAGIDCVIIASPAETHFEYIKKALLAGKHVLVEKPMVIHAAQAAELKALVEKSSKVFMVAHQFLFNEHIQALKSKIESGELGTVENIFAEHLYPGPIRTDVGVFWDAAPHELAIIDYLFGPSEVLNVKGTVKKISGAPVDDYVFADVEFANKICLTLLYSSISPVKSRRLFFAGSKGLAYYDDAQKKEREPLLLELIHFIDCVKKSERPITDINHGIRVIKALDKIYKNLV